MKNLIIFYDGYCGICSWSVDFILRWDKNNIFKFSPLSGIYAKQVLDKKFVDNPSTIVLYSSETGEPLIKSEAALNIAKHLSFPISLFWFFRFIPRVLRDKVYEMVSYYRYNIAKRRTSCRLPGPQEKDKFILE